METILMPRARNIKPNFFKNEHLAEVDPMGRLLFIGLWTLADREGRLEYRPKRIKAELFPYEDCDIEAHIHHLEALGFINIYCDSQYIQVVSFSKHQNPHKNEVSSTIPAPECSSNVPSDTDNIGTTPADSLNLIPESITPNETSDGFKLPSWVNEEAWADFEEHRKAIKKPLTDQARKLNLNKLEGLTKETQVIVVNRTIENRWTGLFPPKPDDISHAPNTLPSGEVVVM